MKKLLFILTSILPFISLNLIAQNVSTTGTVVVRKNSEVATKKESRALDILVPDSLIAKVPNVAMPELRQQTLKEAQMELKMRGLVLEPIKWVSGSTTNKVVRQFENGKEIKAGEMVFRGAKITLEVSNGKKP